jgi:hypothetical protein
MKVCLYSVNFGKYRQETQYGIDRIQFDKNIDYYFFTDNTDIKSKYWNVIYTEPFENDKAKMDKFRHTSKHFKFITPELFKDYDIIIWYDSKLLRKRRSVMYSNIVNYFNKDSNLQILNIKHRVRSDPVKELKTTIKNAELQINDENPNEGKEFMKILKNTEFKIPLIDTECIIRKNNEYINNMFKQVYDILLENGLKRDQTVYNYILEKNNIHNHLQFFEFR